jgi:hypothetical protein
MAAMGALMVAAPWLVHQPMLDGLPGVAACVSWLSGG